MDKAGFCRLGHIGIINDTQLKICYTIIQEILHVKNIQVINFYFDKFSCVKGIHKYIFNTNTFKNIFKKWFGSLDYLWRVTDITCWVAIAIYLSYGPRFFPSDAADSADIPC